MDILMMILAAFSFLSLIFFSVMGKEFYHSELLNADSGSIIGEIVMYVIYMFPWYIRKLFLILISLALCILCVGYYMFE
ncbi:cytochrome c biogenesis protein ResB [Rossellomorea marisflavi]